MEDNIWTVSDFIEQTNLALEHSLGNPVFLQGEVASFTASHGKWVFFDLKEDDHSVSCFMPLCRLNVPLEDGMQIMIRCRPKVTDWGKFSLTVQEIIPLGEGSIKKSFELLKKKLTAEGLFDPDHKFPLPDNLQNIGVISSTSAAGYADFIKILNERWGGLNIRVAHTQVQGFAAVDQILNALKFFNEHGEVQIIAILRGGGSADDLAIFNDERLVRAIAASRIPIITGIGHEVDETLADLAADLRASTPSNAAQMLTQDRHAVLSMVTAERSRISDYILRRITECRNDTRASCKEIVLQIRRELQSLHTDVAALRPLMDDTYTQILRQIARSVEAVQHGRQLLDSANPDQILRRGYAILSGKISPGNVVKITTLKQTITAEVQNVKVRK